MVGLDRQQGGPNLLLLQGKRGGGLRGNAGSGKGWTGRGFGFQMEKDLWSFMRKNTITLRHGRETKQAGEENMETKEGSECRAQSSAESGGKWSQDRPFRLRWVMQGGYLLESFAKALSAKRGGGRKILKKPIVPS